MMADLRAVNQDENYSKIANVLDRLSRGWDQREGKYISENVLILLFLYSDATLYRQHRQSFQRKCHAQAGWQGTVPDQTTRG